MEERLEKIRSCIYFIIIGIFVILMGYLAGTAASNTEAEIVEKYDIVNVRSTGKNMLVRYEIDGKVYESETNHPNITEVEKGDKITISYFDSDPKEIAVYNDVIRIDDILYVVGVTIILSNLVLIESLKKKEKE